MANLNRGLIVSCQAVQGESLYGLNLMQHFAYAAAQGGAVGIRANGVEDIKAIKSRVDLPVIGIIKAVYPHSPVYITPTLKEVKELLTSGCDVIALDCTGRDRPNGEKLKNLVAYIRAYAPSVEIMADVDTIDNAKCAYELGFEYIGSTMRGYTPATNGVCIPDYNFLQEMVIRFPKAHIIAEGGIWERDQLTKVSRTGVYAIVVGTAITRPTDITKRFVGALDLC
ncbi:MAG: N-acetylmannosamine-6-phosphate 2-epimerase [Christensenellales bacterium]